MICLDFYKMGREMITPSMNEVDQYFRDKYGRFSVAAVL